MAAETLAMAAARQVLNKTAPALLERAAAGLGRSIDQVKVQFFKTFQSHIASNLKRSRQVKTVLSKDKAVDLERIYVPLKLSIGERNDVEDVELSPTSNYGARSIISGTGGSGKTVLMKHLLNISVDNSLGLVPLFFELRTLDFSSSEFLQEILYNDMKLAGADERKSLFEIALESGLFAIFLDGFDEIKPDWQPLALKRIDAFSRKFERCSILISTRPNTGVENLVDFNTYHVNRLSKSQALAVVEKTDFEAVTKAKFYKALDEYLYERHRTMMSIPILVAMMLLTFRSYSDIPDRMTVFYAQAFNTLFAIHDSEGKLQFKREYRSKLAPDIFRSVLEAFCFLSLRNHDIEFTHNSFIDYVGKAIKLTRVTCDATSYAEDLVQNVCILQPDGVSYVFVHRSFQEYFASAFALNYSGENPFRVIDQIADPNSSSSLSMMAEMDKARFNRVWLLPKIETVYEELNELKDAPLYTRLGRIVSWIGVANKQLRRASFEGMPRDMYEDLEKIGQFWPGVTLGSIFNPDVLFNDEAEDELAQLAASENSGFVLLEEQSSSDLGYYKINMSIDAEIWLRKTTLAALLDKQLSCVETARKSVKEFVEKQDDLESELLNL